MLERFLYYNFTLFEKKKIVLGCSGGMDSMTLLYLLQQLNCEIIVCHIDHLTRNGQSTQDRYFVERYCKRNNIAFDYHLYRHNEGNFQGESRRFRYKIFQSLMEEETCDHIVTAHNMNDNVESYFIRSVRGTGLKGLKGMDIENHLFLKPLLPFKRSEITQFAEENKVPYVEDPSNSRGDYLRNTIRNEVLPKLEPFIPNLTERVTKTISNIKKDFELLEYLLNNVKSKFIKMEDHVIEVDLIRLESLLLKETILYHLLKEYGVNEDQVKQVFTSSTGSIFETDAYLFNKDRNRLIIQQKKSKTSINLSIPGEGIFKLPNGSSLLIKLKDAPNPLKGNTTLVLSSSKLKFPLQLRNWKDGDRFCPAGMNGKSKKVSKFLKDLKIPMLHKSNILVLVSSDGNICGIPGYRSDHRYTPDDDEKEVLFVQLIK